MRRWSVIEPYDHDDADFNLMLALNTPTAYKYKLAYKVFNIIRFKGD